MEKETKAKKPKKPKAKPPADIPYPRRVDELGRIVIPKEWRDRAGIEENDFLDLRFHRNFIGVFIPSVQSLSLIHI